MRDQQPQTQAHEAVEAQAPIPEASQERTPQTPSPHKIDQQPSSPAPSPLSEKAEQDLLASMHIAIEQETMSMVKLLNQQLAKREPLFQLLDYLGKLSIILAAILFFLQIPGRRDQAKAEAWGVINSAQGQGGNGGRVRALETLTRGCARDRIEGNFWLNSNRNALNIVLERHVDGIFGNCVDLSGLTADGAYLTKSDLRYGVLKNAILPRTNLQEAQFQGANLQQVNFQQADLRKVQFQNAQLQGANFRNAKLEAANLDGAVLQFTDGRSVCRADFRNASGLTVEQIQQAENWEYAKYDEAMRQRLELPAEEQIRATLGLAPLSPEAQPEQSDLSCEPISGDVRP